jgi:hypothetical protein
MSHAAATNTGKLMRARMRKPTRKTVIEKKTITIHVGSSRPSFALDLFIA